MVDAGLTATPTAGFAAIFGVFARTCLGLGLEEVEEREEREGEVEKEERAARVERVERDGEGEKA